VLGDPVGVTRVQRLVVGADVIEVGQPGRAYRAFAFGWCARRASDARPGTASKPSL
jgi:hypothetical protein